MSGKGLKGLLRRCFEYIQLELRSEVVCTGVGPEQVDDGVLSRLYRHDAAKTRTPRT